MALEFQKVSLLLNVIAFLMVVASVAVAQEETTPKDTTPPRNGYDASRWSRVSLVVNHTTVT